MLNNLVIFMCTMLIIFKHNFQDMELGWTDNGNIENLLRSLLGVESLQNSNGRVPFDGFQGVSFGFFLI